MTSDYKTYSDNEDKSPFEERDTNEKENGESLSAAQKARCERNRQQARMLREARLVQPAKTAKSETVEKSAVMDSGGGFFFEEETVEPPRLAVQPAPFVHPSEQPFCLECNQQFAQSYLMDTFDYNVCDLCRNDETHSLMTRTEAKSEFLLQDCDLDSRPPPLRCVRRRNPHRRGAADMRLYLRVQAAERAAVVWGSAAELECERERRRERAERAASTAERRRLRHLRLEARSSLLRRVAPAHAHAYGPERHDPERDVYERSCACGHTETYEKM